MMGHKFSKAGFAFVAILFQQSVVYSLNLPDNTRLTDQLNRTGERVALVLQNDAEESAQASIYGDPAFQRVDPARNGNVSAPRKSLSYKVLYKRSLGYPELMEESAENINNPTGGLRVDKAVFDGLQGMRVNQGVYVQVGVNRCRNIMPDPKELQNLPQFKGADLERLAGITANLNLGVLYITNAANGRSCTAKFLVPGDLSFIEDGLTRPGTTADLDATTVRESAKKWIDAVVDGNAQEGYTPVVTNGAKDGALAVRDQAAQLLAQRTEISTPEIGSKVKWAVGGDDQDSGTN